MTVGFKASYKFLSIQNQDYISHVKQLKSDRYQDRIFFLSIACVHPFFSPKSENLTLTVVFDFFM